MHITGANCLRIFVLFVFLQTNHFCFSQSPGYPYDEWIKKLSSKKQPFQSGFQEIFSALRGKDLPEATAIFNALEEKGKSSGAYFATRVNLIKAYWFWNSNLPGKVDSTQQFMKKAINTAYETDDESLVSYISWQYGSLMYWAGLTEPATMYSLYAAELDEKAGITSSSQNYTLLGDLLYRTRDYEKAIYYTRKAIDVLPDSALAKRSIMSLQNTIALCWQRMDKYDSAFFYFHIAMRMAKEINDSIWMSIISGNEGQIYFAQKNYSTARHLLEYDYQQSTKFGEVTSAANSLQWVARIDLIEGKKDSALIRVRAALQVFDPGATSNYLENVYYATADVYRAFGNYDSAYKYAQLYNQQHELNERTVANSRLEIARIKLDNLQQMQALKNLRREKDAEKLKRNFIIAIIILIAVIVMFFFNRMRLKHRHNEQLALQQKAAAETEVTAAHAELDRFKKNVIEKTGLIEKLQQQADEKQANFGQQAIIDELTHQTILTEDEWEKFKSLFEKINPQFFIHLKEKAPDITIAEQRMAALMRLQLGSKQVASMLGISVDSVRKTRLRLRKRLGLSVEEEVEHWLNDL